MKTLNDHPTCRIYGHRIDNAGDWEEPPVDHRKYVALLAKDDSEFDERLLAELTTRLIESGCLSITVWAPDADKAWDVLIKTKVEMLPDDEPFVMTYGHSGVDAEGAEELATHLMLCTDFDDHVFVDYLLLFLDGAKKSEQLLTEAIRNELGEGQEFFDLMSPEMQQKYIEHYEREGGK